LRRIKAKSIGRDQDRHMSTVVFPRRVEEGPLLSDDLLRRFDAPGPRYTSYPTADRFDERFGPVESAAELRRLAGAAGATPLSVYVHIPFCESVCYYCACNKVITRHHERAGEYLDALETEIGLVAASLGRGRPVSQLHFGGGSPTFLSDPELERVMAAIRRTFHVGVDAELSIEVDPRTVTPERLGHLRALGFNRISFGVQDFDPEVQVAVHRVQPIESVRVLMDSARCLGYESINADLIYGLPRQTPESFARTISQIGELRPDRIALYAYAHLPQRFKPQRRILGSELPDGAARLAMLGHALTSFLDHGYSYIGMDHFALAQDALAVAKREGGLQRNFQGYSTQPDCDLVALGVSAIGRIGATYHQNAKTLPEYYESLSEGRLPVVRGITLTADDLIRRDVIMTIMCRGRLDFGAVDRTHTIASNEYFADELAQLTPLVAAGLVAIDPAGLHVTPSGWYVVRAIAMVFDRYLRGDQARERFSRII
jgi:oxygen-independent coproporphyrinogen-3 oxidase